MAETAMGPIVVGGSGGSGTRALTELLAANGVALPSDCNAALDCMVFEAFLRRRIDPILAVTRGLDYRFEDLPAAMRREVADDLAETLAEMRASLQPGDAPRWGWKCPRNVFVLPVLAALVPDLVFVHLVRDGRDMLLSRNQNQSRRHFDALTGASRRSDPRLAAAVTWMKVNLEVARFGAAALGPRYVRCRYEDLCADDPTARLQLLAALDLPSRRLDGIFSLSEGTGRWRNEAPHEARRLYRAIGAGLVAFGYVDAATLAVETKRSPFDPLRAVGRWIDARAKTLPVVGRLLKRRHEDPETAARRERRRQRRQARAHSDTGARSDG
jgi:hypothetical protein